MIKIRTFEPSDFDAVAEIYQQGIDTGIATFQTSAKNWDEWDTSLLSHSRLVATDQHSQVLAWAALSSVSNRCVYGGVAEVTIYVSTMAQGKGVGKSLLNALVIASEQAGIWSLKAGIFPQNIVSIKLHESCGFRVLGIQEKLGKIGNRWQDVALLERRSKTIGVD